MAERASVTQHVQIGVETTPGTAVAATKQLRSVGIAPTPHVTVQEFTPPGQKYVSLAIEGEEWVEAALTGNVVYDELVYPASGVLGAATVTAGTGAAVGTYTWVFNPSPVTSDVYKTFTVQHGDPNSRADSFTYGAVTDLAFSIDRSKFEMTGTMLGQRLTDGITMTPTPTLLPLVPIVPGTVSVFCDTTAAGIGTTRLTRVLSFEWHIADKQGPIWTIDATQMSFAALVELLPALTATMVLEADSNGMAFLNTLRLGSTVYFQISATGPNIGTTAIPYTFNLQLPMKITNTSGFEDSNGVYAISWDFVSVYDTTFNAGAGGAMLLTLVNSLATL